MNKILYFTFLLFCIAVSSKCNVIYEEPEGEIEENCLEVSGDPSYFENLTETVETSFRCVKNVFDLQFDQAITDNSKNKYYQADFLRSICEKREDYYTCLSIGLDAYTHCLSPEENVGLSKIRRVFRRVISQICEADIEKIFEFLSGDGLRCYKENLNNILRTVTLMFFTRRNEHLPSSYINDKTCGDLTKLQQDLKPVINLCENKSPGIFLEHLVNAIEDELSCESENLAHENEI